MWLFNSTGYIKSNKYKLQSIQWDHKLLIFYFPFNFFCFCFCGQMKINIHTLFPPSWRHFHGEWRVQELSNFQGNKQRFPDLMMFQVQSKSMDSRKKNWFKESIVYLVKSRKQVEEDYKTQFHHHMFGKFISGFMEKAVVVKETSVFYK